MRGQHVAMEHDDRIERCAAELRALRLAMLDAERRHLASLPHGASARGTSLRNFLHYLALRTRDVRPLQDDLAELGLSSLGRAESHVLHTIEAALRATEALAGRRAPAPERRGALSCAEGHALLEAHTQALLGPRPDGRSVRIMVTLASDGAPDRPFVRTLLARGMNVARINCAHDDPDAWARMAENVRRASEEVGRPCRIQMDLGGPKLRTGECAPGLTVRTGDVVVLTRSQERGRPPAALPDGTTEPARIPCSLPEALDDLGTGHTVFLDDGKIGGTVEETDAAGARVRITHAKPKGSAVRSDRGINLPDTTLRLPPLATKDRADLRHVVALADLVALSFVQRREDIDEIEAELGSLGADRLGLVLKIETRSGFTELPALLLRAVSDRPLGVMIARGDMAVECGYLRLAEI